MDEQRMTKADMAREWIAKEIRIGNFARGSVLPPERELAVQIGVSYMTLRKAVSALVQEGILERNHGSGTFVCNEIPEQKVQKILGLVQPAWAAPETLDTVMYFSQACEEANWLLKVVNARSWEDRSLLDLWQNCDALALTMIQQAEKMPRILLEKLCSPAKPVVAVCSSAEHIDRDSVYYLNDARMEEPCDRLYELGHRRIFLVDQLVREYGILASIHPSLTGFGQVFRAKYPDVEYNSSMMSLEVPFFQLAHHAIRQAQRTETGNRRLQRRRLPAELLLGGDLRAARHRLPGAGGHVGADLRRPAGGGILLPPAGAFLRRTERSGVPCSRTDPLADAESG